jgi:GntR family transcriptional regulator, arabinose operon transcriptional repressor
MDAENPERTPKYLRVKEHLLDLASRLEWKQGQRLPSEHELARQFEFSRNTVRQALSELEREGVISRARGRGTSFVQGPQPSAAVRHFLISLRTSAADYIYPSIIRGADGVLSRAGYHLVIGSQAADRTRVALAGPAGVRWKPDGHLFEPTAEDIPLSREHLAELLKAEAAPVVLLNWAVEHPEISFVSPDDVAAGATVRRYLESRGHRRIAYVGLRGHGPSELRYQGLRGASASGPEDPLARWLEEAPRDRQPARAYAASRDLLAMGRDRPTAIFYFNDQVAIHGYHAIRESGLQIPDDVSVVGFDDADLGRAVHPPLTTMEHPKAKIGEWAARILLDQLDTPGSAAPVHLLLPCRLVERGSVRDLI